MNHVIVTRVTIAVSALCVGAALLFAYLVGTPASRASIGAGAAQSPADSMQREIQTETHPGEELYNRFCAGCHTLEEAVQFMQVGGANVDANAGLMVEFLKSHSRANDEQDRIIVEYILKHVT